MAERLKDKEDQVLDAMFGSAPIADDGFSAKTLSRLRRQIWIRRLTLPVAFVVGAAIAAKPLSQLVVSMIGFASSVGGNLGSNLDSLPISGIPQAPVLIAAILLVVGMTAAGKLIED